MLGRAPVSISIPNGCRKDGLIPGARLRTVFRVPEYDPHDGGAVADRNRDRSQVTGHVAKAARAHRRDPAD